MAIPRSGTFDYAVVVPVENARERLAWPASVIEPIPVTGNPMMDDRLVGMTPTLSIGDEDAPFKGEGADRLPPDARRSKITLTASTRDRARVRSVSFHVAAELIERLNSEEVIHFARTASGGFGLSVLRGDQLVMAAGAVDSVPLGSEVTAKVLRAELFVMGADRPLIVSFAGNNHTVAHGHLSLGSYELVVDYAHRDTIPGDDVCAAISRSGEGGLRSARATALYLRNGLVAMDGW